MKQDGELISPQTGNGVLLADELLESTGNLDEQFIAGLMAQAVVDDLEVVQVHEDDRDPALPSPGARDGVLQPIQELGAVGEAGESVVEGLVFDPGLQPFPFGDVLHEKVEAFGGVGPDDGDFGMEEGVVGPHGLNFHRLFARDPGDLDRIPKLLLIRAVDECLPGSLPKLVSAVAQVVGEGDVIGDDAPLGIHSGDAFHRML